MATDYDEIVNEARDLFAADEADEAELRQEAREDIRFVAGRQWDEHSLNQRKLSNRPALTFNRLPTFVGQVSNEARQNKPAIRFQPAEDGDKETADVYEGLARQIQQASSADIAYQTAVEYSSMGGFGHFRLLTDWSDDESFHQEIRFAPVYDPFSVYGVLVPTFYGKRPTHAFVIEDLSHAEFEQQYPGAELVSIGFDSDVARNSGWVMTRNVRVAEYWKVTTQPRKLLLLSTGEAIWADELAGGGGLPPEITVAREREVQIPTVRWFKINGVEVLDETVWQGTRIPIFTALGRQIVVDGRPELISLVRFMRDPQRLLNIFKSGIAEQLQLASRSPYVMAEGQDEGYEGLWANANQVNYSRLLYKPQALGGHLVPPPQRNQFEAPIQALSAAAAQEIDDLKAIGGIFDASLGAQSNETSGIAITRRQQQSGLTNYHFLDNLHRAQEEAGKEMAVLIPRVYDSDRMVRILGEDEQAKIVRINVPYVDGRGRKHDYQLSRGKYDVVVTTGASYTTKRQESFDLLTQFAQGYPQLIELGGDVIFQNSDIPGGDILAERFKKRLPPELVEDEGEEPIPPQVLAQLQQLQQQNQLLLQELEAQTRTIENKQLELASRERIAALQAQVQMLMTQAKLDSAEGIAMLRAQLEELRTHVAAMQTTAPGEDGENEPQERKAA